MTGHTGSSSSSGLRLGPPPADAAAVVVAVHGRGQTPQYMVDNLIQRLGDQQRRHTSFIVPAATDGTWYPLGFLAPIVDNQPSLDDALASMAAIEAELHDVDPLRVVWAGFSQGACLLSEHLARHPRRWGGAIILTGGMIGPPDHPLTVHGSFGGMPAYFSNGDVDDWVPLWRTEATADQYRAAGADVTFDVFQGRAHEIGDAEIARIQILLDGVTT